MWDELAGDAELERAVKALKENGFVVFVVDDGKEAKAKLMALIRRGAEVNSATLTTLDQIGVTGEIESSGNYIALRKEVLQTTDLAKRDELRKRAQVAEYCIGSVHAVTEDGHIVVASATGSQIAPYAYGANKLILVASSQKLVKDIGEAFGGYTITLSPRRTSAWKRYTG